MPRAQSDQLRARILHRQGELDQARPLSQRALDAAHKNAAEHPDFLTDAVINFASFALSDGDAQTSIALSCEGIERLTSDHGSGDIRLAEPLHNLANALASAQRWDEAAAEYRRALAITDQHLSPKHQTNAFLRNGLARAEQRLGNVEGARNSFHLALEILRANFGEVHPDIGITLANVGRLESNAGQIDAAL
ncbi:MAG: tetratricopeptide repeat protein [Pseudomonadota bacterium]